MRSSYLSPNSPAELIVGVAGSSGYFDIPAHGTSMPQTSPLSDLVPKWDASWVRGGGLFGPNTRTCDVVEVADVQSPSAVTDIWKDFARSQPGMGSSPRQRPGFLRDATTSTPAFFLSPSPLARDSAFPSPSLPFVAPDAPTALRSNRLLARRVQKKASAPGRWADSQALWLAGYFFFNLSLTLYNKGVLVHFPFPYTLTAVHALFGSIGGHLLRRRNVYVPARLDPRSYIILAAFSVLYAINIAISNLSLQLVTIPFHQVVRATTPIFTTLLSTMLLGTRFSSTKLITLLPVMLGVTLATYGDYYFTALGFLLTLLGTFLAAAKTIYTNILQSTSSLSKADSNATPSPISRFLAFSRLDLHPLDLLTRLSPLAFAQCVVYAHYSGELTRIRVSVAASGASWSGWFYVLVLFGNGCIAFGLNVVSFIANGKVGALNMTVAANVKQVLTIMLAVAIFNLTITHANALGILVTIVGGACYAWVEYTEKGSKRTDKGSAVR